MSRPRGVAIPAPSPRPHWRPEDVQCAPGLTLPSLLLPPTPGAPLPAEVHEEGMSAQDLWSPCGAQGLAGAHVGVEGEEPDSARHQPAKGPPHVAPT